MTTQSLLLVLLSSALLFGCADKENLTSCGVENPVEDLAWLKQEIENASVPSSSEYSFLMQASYQGQTVFFFGFCNPLWNYAAIYKDCQGNRISGKPTFADLSNQKVIWKPENSVCTFS